VALSAQDQGLRCEKLKTLYYACDAWLLSQACMIGRMLLMRAPEAETSFKQDFGA
jgi:hypothetical protein